MNPVLVDYSTDGEEYFRELVLGRHLKPESLAQAIAWAALNPDAASGLQLSYMSGDYHGQ